MKNLFTVFILGLLISYSAKAQKNSYGIRAGLNLIPVQSNTLEHNNLLKPGLNAGIYYNYHINEQISLQTELYYTFKTSSYSSTDTASLLSLIEMSGINTEDLGGVIGYFDLNVYQRTNAKVNMNYLELPLMFNYDPFNFINFGLGVYGSYLISSQNFISYKEDIPLLDATNLLDSFPEASMLVNFMYPAYNQAQSSQKPSKNRYTSFDFGFVTDITLKTEKDIFLSFRYTRGLIKYSSNSNEDKNVHSAFQLILAYPLSKFYLGIKTKSTKPRIE
ncbi:MAG: PorT family protein [Bacteroidota bacterium]|nr:PorT family protein [Bacteroidota bacterium]